MIRTYDPKGVLVIVNGIPLYGFADGTFIRVERDDDMFTKVVGADGMTSRAKSNNKGGKITITLKQTSPSNDVLSGIALADEMTNAGVVPIMIKEMSKPVPSQSLAVSGFGWVQKQPVMEYGKEITNREWIFDCADLEIVTLGVPPAGVV